MNPSENNLKITIDAKNDDSLRTAGTKNPLDLEGVHKEIDEAIKLAKEDFKKETDEAIKLAKEDFKKETDEAIKLAKEDFLKTAKTDASEEIRKQVQTDKASLITVFGIFASIISFLTIEFQFLRTICSFEKLIGFTLILFSLLLCFNLALDYLVKSRTDKQTPKPNIIFSIFVIILFILGIHFMYLGNEENCKDNKIYTKYSDDFTNQQMEFNQNYANKQNMKYSEIKAKIVDIEKQIKK